MLFSVFTLVACGVVTGLAAYATTRFYKQALPYFVVMILFMIGMGWIMSNNSLIHPNAPWLIGTDLYLGWIIGRALAKEPMRHD